MYLYRICDNKCATIRFVNFCQRFSIAHHHGIWMSVCDQNGITDDSFDSSCHVCVCVRACMRISVRFGFVCVCLCECLFGDYFWLCCFVCSFIRTYVRLFARLSVCSYAAAASASALCVCVCVCACVCLYTLAWFCVIKMICRAKCSLDTIFLVHHKTITVNQSVFEQYSKRSHVPHKPHTILFT